MAIDQDNAPGCPAAPPPSSTTTKKNLTGVYPFDHQVEVRLISDTFNLNPFDTPET